MTSRRLATTLKSKPKNPLREIILFISEQISNKLLQNIKYHQSRGSKQNLKNAVESMRATAADAQIISLAANQVNDIQHNLFVAHSCIFKDQLKRYQWSSDEYANSKDYHYFLNPKLVSGKTIIEEDEESISFPFIHCSIKRYNQIKVIYENIEKQSTVCELKGFAARIFQQNVDQLNGQVILDWRINNSKIYIQKDMESYFPKSTTVLEQYSKQMQKLFVDFPEIIPMFPEEIDFQNKPNNSFKGQLVNFEEDAILRLTKHYRRQLSLINEKIKLGLVSTSDSPQNGKSEEDLEPKSKIKIIKQ